MTLDGAYENILTRMKLSSNAKKYDHLINATNHTKNEMLILVYQSHIAQYLSDLNSEDLSVIYKNFLTSSCSAAISSLISILNSEGWKKE